MTSIQSADYGMRSTEERGVGQGLEDDTGMGFAAASRLGSYGSCYVGPLDQLWWMKYFVLRTDSTEHEVHLAHPHGRPCQSWYGVLVYIL